tara:strand:+ start:175 stop:309 length:135 start_codon:yes stop_codon:yes gene_type:complete
MARKTKENSTSFVDFSSWCAVVTVEGAKDNIVSIDLRLNTDAAP